MEVVINRDGRIEEETRSMVGVLVRVIGVLNKQILLYTSKKLSRRTKLKVYSAISHAHCIMPPFL